MDDSELKYKVSLTDFKTDLSDYWSCEYLEAGLSFSYSSIRACAIIHHGTGEPTLMQYLGGEVSLDEILIERQVIIQQNQTQERHPNCHACPNLIQRSWSRSQYPVHWLGITAWLGCNLKCSYCWLEWADWSPRLSATKIPMLLYSVQDSIHQLIDKGYLAPNAVIDWGGGGEPLLMPHFEEMLMLLSAHGTTQWLHTNATYLPTAIRDRAIEGSRIKVLCSVDAGSSSVYRSLKGRDLYAVVWQNLQAYASAGAAVTVKYIMLPVNCSRIELRRFIKQAILNGRPTILGDFDHRFPELTPEIFEGLAYLQLLANKYGLAYSLGGVGQNSFTDQDLKSSIEAYFPLVYRDPYLYPSRIEFRIFSGWYRFAIALSSFLRPIQQRLSRLCKPRSR